LRLRYSEDLKKITIQGAKGHPSLVSEEGEIAMRGSYGEGRE
jgi:hypothetical protein